MNFPTRSPLWEKCLLKKTVSYGAYGVPSQFVKTSMADFTNDDKAADVVMRLIEKSPLIWSKGYNLLITGNRGVGKSHLAAEMVKACVNYIEHVAYFIGFEELLSLLDRTRFVTRASEEDVVRLANLKTCELLVIDGLHDEVEFAPLRTALAGLVGFRSSREDISTVLTTYIAPTDLPGAFGDRLAGDIIERFMQVKVEGTSHRLKGMKTKMEELYE